jgi:hypothetical protein
VAGRFAFQPRHVQGLPGSGFRGEESLLLAHIGRPSGRSLQVNDEGVLVRDSKGNQIGGIHWVELGRVSERRKMAQLALWDKKGARRVLIDQQYQNFAAIRQGVLAEYAKAFLILASGTSLSSSSESDHPLQFCFAA